MNKVVILILLFNSIYCFSFKGLSWEMTIKEVIGHENRLGNTNYKRSIYLPEEEHLDYKSNFKIGKYYFDVTYCFNNKNKLWYISVFLKTSIVSYQKELLVKYFTKLYGEEDVNYRLSWKNKSFRYVIFNYKDLNYWGFRVMKSNPL